MGHGESGLAPRPTARRPPTGKADCVVYGFPAAGLVVTDVVASNRHGQDQAHGSSVAPRSRLGLESFTGDEGTTAMDTVRAALLPLRPRRRCSDRSRSLSALRRHDVGASGPVRRVNPRRALISVSRSTRRKGHSRKLSPSLAARTASAGRLSTFGRACPEPPRRHRPPPRHRVDRARVPADDRAEDPHLTAENGC